MAFIPTICSQCGASLKIIEGEECTCEFCGSKYIPEKAATIVQVNNTIIEGGVTINSLLERAFMLIQDRNWREAFEKVNRVLDADPKNGIAWLYRYLIECGCSSISEINEKNVRTGRILHRVLEFAPSDIKATLQAKLDEINAAIKRKRLIKMVIVLVVVLICVITFIQWYKQGVLFESLLGLGVIVFVIWKIVKKIRGW